MTRISGLRPTAWWSAAVVVAAAGCGGVTAAPDAGMETDAATEPDAAVELGPTVVSTSPRADANGVALDAVVTVTFDVAIDPATVDGTSFVLETAAGAPIAAAVEVDGATATLTPGASLVLDTPYTAAVTTAVADLDGNPLADRYAWTFTIRAGSWGTAELLEDDMTYAIRAPRVAMNPAGDAIAVWRHFDGDHYNIWSSQRAAGGSWDVPVQISNGAFAAFAPKIGIDADGNAVAVFEQGNNMWANRYAAGVGWEGPARIEEAGGDAHDPRLAVGAAGDAVAVWKQGTALFSNRYEPGTGWSEAAPIPTLDTGGEPERKWVAVNASGDAVAIWRQADAAGVRSVWASRLSAGGTWSSPDLLETSDGQMLGIPVVAIAPSGEAVAVWHQLDELDDTRNDVWANRYDGTAWGAAELLETDDAGSALNPKVVADAHGGAVAVWRQSDGTRFNAWASHFRAESGWSDPVLLETDDAGDVTSGFSLAGDAAGGAVVLVRQSDGTRDNVWASRYAAGAGWDAPTLVETSDAAAFHAVIDVSATGAAAAVWRQSDGMRSSTWANVYE